MLSDIQPLEGTFDLRYSAMPDTFLLLMQAFGKQISRKVKSIHKACKYIMNMTILSIFMILMGNSVSEALFPEQWWLNSDLASIWGQPIWSYFELIAVYIRPELSYITWEIQTLSNRYLLLLGSISWKLIKCLCKFYSNVRVECFSGRSKYILSNTPFTNANG